MYWKANSRANWKRFSQTKKSFIIFTIFISNLSQFIFLPLADNCSMFHSVIAAYSHCLLCNNPRPLYHTYTGQENYIWLLIMIGDNYSKLHVSSLRDKCQSVSEFRRSSVCSPAPCWSCKPLSRGCVDGGHADHPGLHLSHRMSGKFLCIQMLCDEQLQTISNVLLQTLMV